MNVRHIQKRLAGGFKPFVVVTSGGHKFPVPHPEFLFITPTTPHTVIVAGAGGTVVTLDPLHIVGLQDMPAPRNGKTKRARKG